MPLPFGQAHWGGQEVRGKFQCTRWPPHPLEFSGAPWTLVSPAFPCYLTNQEAFRLLRQLSWPLRRGLHGAEATPVLGLLGRVVMSSEHRVFRAGKGCLMDLSASLKDLQGLARYTQTLDEDMDPWSNFLPKGSL